MSGIAPVPNSPERFSPVYERKLAPSMPGNRGPLRFEEGVATDTDVPNDFIRGMTEGASQMPRNMVDPETQYKHAAEVLQERAHVGSASWTESPQYLGEFAGGTDEPPQTYVQVDRSGGRYERSNPALVVD